MRLPNTSDNSAVTTLTTIRQQLDALKQAQPSAASNIVMQLNQTANSYDHTASVAYGGSKTFQVIFTSTRQAYAITDLTARLYMDSMSNEVFFGAAGYQQPMLRQIATSNPSIWYVTIYGNASGTHTYYVKYCVQSTDKGTVSPL